jgi:hypothetical protein
MTDDINKQEDQEEGYPELELKGKIRYGITKTLGSLTLEELEELQDWLDEKRTVMKTAYIQSINALLSDMTVEQLEKIEAYADKIG